VIHTYLARKRTGDAEIGWRPASEKKYWDDALLGQK
jgi:hypothetical protein